MGYKGVQKGMKEYNGVSRAQKATQRYEVVLQEKDGYQMDIDMNKVVGTKELEGN